MGSNAASALFLLLLLLLLLIAVAPAVLAETFRVGDTAGWSKGVNYNIWVTGKTFRVGDTLGFQYGPLHSVFVVDKVGFDGCNSTGSTESFSGGDTKINLTIVGNIYFISPTTGDCSGGMKLAVPVLPAASSPFPSASLTASTPVSNSFLDRLRGRHDRDARHHRRRRRRRGRRRPFTVGRRL